MLAVSTQSQQMLVSTFDDLWLLPWMLAVGTKHKKMLAGSLVIKFNELRLLPWMLTVCTQLKETLTGSFVLFQRS
jgi:hypothetical protein